MTLKFTQLRTYWSTEEAASVISFLDELRDSLWVVYGNDIIEMYRAEGVKSAADSLQDFDDDIDF